MWTLMIQLLRAFSSRKVKVLLKDVDLVRWKQDLSEDRDRLVKLVQLPKT